MPKATASQIKKWEQQAVSTATHAAALIRQNLTQNAGLRVKSSPTDVVTQTDLDSERLIRAELLEAAPDVGIIGEEENDVNPQASLQWIIDPLDGTVNFTYGIPLFAVSIAAAYHGTLVAGAVVDVLRDETFSAGLGLGARCNGEPLNSSTCLHLESALITTGFSYDSSTRRAQGEVVARLLPHVRDVRCFGSAALQMCWLAAGRVDGYYERDTKIWDYAAGALICEETGTVVELQCPENDNLVIGAPPSIFTALRRQIQIR